MEDSPVRFFFSKPHKIFAAVIVGAIAFNAIFALLPPQIRRVSINPKDMFHISDESVRFLSEIGDAADDVDIYFLTSDGKEDYQVYEFLQRYVAKNPRINLHTVNVNFDDTRVREYLDGGVSEHSIIVKSSKRARVIDYGDLFYFYNWDEKNSVGLGRIPPSLYQDYYEKYTQYFLEIPTTFHFDGENLLSNAIKFVLSDNVPTVYCLAGHGELDVSAVFELYLDSTNRTLKFIDISAMDSLPDDCDVLLINGPQKDLSEHDAALIGTYLDGGGRLMLNKGYDLSLPRLDALLKKYGVGQNPGLVCEGDDTLYVNQGQNVFPQYIIGTPLDHPITASLAGKAYMMFLNSGDISVAEQLPDGVSAEAFFVTSELAYRQLSEQKNDISKTGTCTLGVAIEAQTSGEKSARIAFFACENVLNDLAIELTGGGNLAYAGSVLSWLAEKEETTLTIGADLVSGSLSLKIPTLIFWTVVLVVILPAGVIITGAVNRYKRKNR